MADVQIPETNKIILKVSDKASTEHGMFNWLQERGVAIVQAGSTAKAMELLERYQYLFDAVITNLRRIEPGSKIKNNNAGIELTQQIRRFNQKIPIFIYTLNIDHAIRVSAKDSGVTVITTNPIELQDALKKYGV